MEDLSEEPPTDIDPYQALGIEQTATASDVKSAYKRLALQNHPDKVAPDARDTAHVRFQEIAFAYAILSDERRRKRYDDTGNTSESLSLDDDDFNWVDFFRSQWKDAVTGDTLNNFKNKYQGSEEERIDVLSAFKSKKGKMNAIFKEVMLSNPIYDEERFRGYIDAAIDAGELEPSDAYVNEPKKKKTERHKKAAREEQEAKAHAKDIGIYDTLFGKSEVSTSKKAGKSEDGLADLIQQRQKGRAATFLDDLEAKYTGGTKKQNGKKRKSDEPPEEAFQRNRQTKQKRQKSTKSDANGEFEADANDDGLVIESIQEEQGNSEPSKPKMRAKKGGNGGKKRTAPKV